MKAAILTKTLNIEILEVEKPIIGENEVLIKVVETGICGSDLHTYEGVHPFRKPPVILGHEVSGEVCEVGKKVSDIDIGTRVVVEPQKSCEKCSYCIQGRYNICPKKLMPGIGGWGGSFAEFFASPADKIYPIKESISYTSGVLTEPISVGLHAARIATEYGTSTLIIGLGSIGIGAVIASKMLGSKLVVATDIAELNLKVAKNLGADFVINVTKQNLETATKKFAPEGFDSVIVASGYPRSIDDAILLSKRGARIVLVSLFSNVIESKLNPLVLQEKEIVGSCTYTRNDFKTVINWLNDNKLKPDEMVTHVMPLKKASEALNLLHKKNRTGN